MTKPIMVFQCRKLGGEAGGIAKLTIEGCATNWRRSNGIQDNRAQPRGEQKPIPSAACRGCAVGESHARDGKAANGVRLLPLAPHAEAAPPPRAAIPAKPERVMPESAPTAPRSMTADSIIARAASVVARCRASGVQARYPEQVMADLVTLVAKGSTVTSLAEATGIPANTIGNACKRYGVKPKRGNPRLRPEAPAEPAAATSAPTEEPDSQDEPAEPSPDHQRAVEWPSAPIEPRTILAIQLPDGGEALVSFPKRISPIDLATAGHALIGRSIMAVRELSSRASQEGSKP